VADTLQEGLDFVKKRHAEQRLTGRSSPSVDAPVRLILAEIAPYCPSASDLSARGLWAPSLIPRLDSPNRIAPRRGRCRDDAVAAAPDQGLPDEVRRITPSE